MSFAYLSDPLFRKHQDAMTSKSMEQFFQTSETPFSRFAGFIKAIESSYMDKKQKHLDEQFV